MEPQLRNLENNSANESSVFGSCSHRSWDNSLTTLSIVWGRSRPESGDVVGFWVGSGPARCCTIYLVVILLFKSFADSIKAEQKNNTKNE
jgi:hypothetical protein